MHNTYHNTYLCVEVVNCKRNLFVSILDFNSEKQILLSLWFHIIIIIIKFAYISIVLNTYFFTEHYYMETFYPRLQYLRVAVFSGGTPYVS